MVTCCCQSIFLPEVFFLPEEQLMRGQQVLSADSEDLWDEQYQMEVSVLFCVLAELCVILGCFS